MSTYNDILKKTMCDRNSDIYKQYTDGVSIERLSKKYNLSKSRISSIIKKEKDNENTFYKALQKACVQLKKETMATKIYNILYKNGLVYHICKNELNLDDFTDNDLKNFDGIGDSSVDIIRMAWNLFKSNETPKLPIPDYELRGYLTGNDLISLIRKHKLGDKKIYYAGHDCIGFEISTICVDGYDQSICGDLNVCNGNFIKFGDNID